jgi:hypothetical protein
MKNGMMKIYNQINWNSSVEKFPQFYTSVMKFCQHLKKSEIAFVLGVTEDDYTKKELCSAFIVTLNCNRKKNEGFNLVTLKTRFLLLVIA